MSVEIIRSRAGSGNVSNTSTAPQTVVALWRFTQQKHPENEEQLKPLTKR
jgi:hypothetical protein